MEVLVAREPILDASGHIFGYELSFRSGPNDSFDAAPESMATAQMISSICFAQNLETYAGRRKAFINATCETIIAGHVAMLPKELTVVEIPGATAPDEQLLTACRDLKRGGYLIALTNPVAPPAGELLSVADFIKLDVQTTTPEQRLRLTTELPRGHLRLIAEKVETPEIFTSARAEGFDLFQGYYFAIPTVISGRDIAGHKLSYSQLLAALQRQDLEIDEIEEIVKSDISLTYKLLRYINSAFFGLRNRVDSIRHALLLLGMRDVRRWASLVTLTGVNSDQPTEFLVQSMVRARFCESIAPYAGMAERGQEAFLLGVLSMVDAAIGRPLVEIVETLPLDDELRDALLGEPGRMRDVLDCVSAYERADWITVSKFAAKLQLDEHVIAQCYARALRWAQRCNDIEAAV